MITVYLVRHGQSTWNVIGRIQGKQDPPLSALGRRQALALAHALRGETLDAIYSSPQKRAHMTANAVATDHKLPVKLVEGLAEIDHGYWEGLTEEEVRRRFEISFYTWLTRPSQTHMPGGEHCLAVQERVLDSWSDIVTHHACTENSRSDGNRLLVVSHDIPIKMIIASILSLSLDQIRQFVLDNAAISIVQGTDSQLQLIQLNDRCHLDLMRDA